MEQASSNVPSPKLSLKNKYIKSAVILLTVFLFVGGLAYVWNQWLSPAAIEGWKYDLYQKYYVDKYENAMREDVWGGKTPEETLQLFIEALKKGDIELASKYFALNTNENSEYYLTHEEWKIAIEKTRDERGLESIISGLKDLKPVGYSESYKWKDSKGFSFEKLNEDGTVGVTVELVSNPYSGVWKIESM